MSTIGEEATQRCIVGFVDAPVLGTREPAEQGKLVVLESGPEEAPPRVQPVFDAIGHRTIRAGHAGAGTRLKLVTNSWVLVPPVAQILGRSPPSPGRAPGNGDAWR